MDTDVWLIFQLIDTENVLRVAESAFETNPSRSLELSITSLRKRLDRLREVSNDYPWKP